MKDTLNTCSRCGTCCRKGGATLHQEDLYLLKENMYAKDSFVTIRRGELGFDPKALAVIPLKEEIIKLRGQANTHTCIFFSEETSGCTRYDARPIECSALDCKNPENLLKIYSENLISRKDIFSDAQGLWEVIEEHEKQCPMAEILSLLPKLRNNSNNNDKEAGKELIMYAIMDDHFRQAVQKKMQIDNVHMMNLLFGRPLQTVLYPSGIHLKRNGESFQYSLLRGEK